MQQFDVFWKLSQNFHRNVCDGNHFWKSLSCFKTNSGKGFLLSVFRTPFYGCFETLNRNAFLWMITLFGANSYSRVIKDFSKSGSLFLSNAPKYLGAILFYSLYAQTLRIFWHVFLSKKNSVKLKRFHCKENSSLV